VLKEGKNYFDIRKINMKIYSQDRYTEEGKCRHIHGDNIHAKEICEVLTEHSGRSQYSQWPRDMEGRPRMQAGDRQESKSAIFSWLKSLRLALGWDMRSGLAESLGRSYLLYKEGSERLLSAC